GELFPFLQEAVKDKRLTDLGSGVAPAAKDYFREVKEEGALLIGFDIGLTKFLNSSVIGAVRPIYKTKTGEASGQWQGPVPASPLTVKARDGYVVGGLTVRKG